MSKTGLITVVLAALIHPNLSSSENLSDPGFDDPEAWTFHQFNGSGSGGVAESHGFITHAGGGGTGGTLSSGFPETGPGSLIDGGIYLPAVDRRYTELGQSAVAEFWLGEDPALSGAGDYPGTGSGVMILKDDCWGSACGSTGGFAPMPQGGGSGSPWTYISRDWDQGRVWFVLKVHGWGPGHAQTVEFDNASFAGPHFPPPTRHSSWMLY